MCVDFSLRSVWVTPLGIISTQSSKEQSSDSFLVIWDPSLNQPPKMPEALELSGGLSSQSSLSHGLNPKIVPSGDSQSFRVALCCSNGCVLPFLVGAFHNSAKKNM